MKQICLLLFFSVFMVSCQSKEEKAAELIKNELSKTLYDFESYSPIETIVSEAKLSVYTDTSCWKKANLLLYAFNYSKECLDKAQNAQKRMEIWGPPTRYSSSYSDNQYYKYKKEWDEKTKTALASWELLKALAKSLKDTLQTLDSEKVIGWEVKHRFRCKNKGGNSAIGDYRYVIDKNFKTVLIREDTDEDEYKNLRELVEGTLKGDFESED